MFVNEVSFEARGFTLDGVEIIVKKIASATSEISFEDAWIKAHAVAKQKAEATLAEKLKLSTEEVKEKLVCLKGERGFPGQRGPKGDTASMSSFGNGSVYVGYVSNTRTIEQINNVENNVARNRGSTGYGSTLDTQQMNGVSVVLNTFLDALNLEYNSTRDIEMELSVDPLDGRYDTTMMSGSDVNKSFDTFMTGLYDQNLASPLMRANMMKIDHVERSLDINDKTKVRVSFNQSALTILAVIKEP